MIQITERLLLMKELVAQMKLHFSLQLQFLGANYSLYFAKITTALALSNSPDLHFSKYIKMSKWPKIV